MSDEDVRALLKVGRGPQLTAAVNLEAPQGRVETGSAEWRRRYDAGVKRRSERVKAQREGQWAAVCAALRSGLLVSDALPLAGVSEHQHRYWRERYPDYRRMVVDAKVEGRDVWSRSTGRIDKMPFAVLRWKLFGRVTYPFQQTIVDLIENAPEGEIVMILLPPGVGKTMTLEDWISIELGKDHSKRIVVTSETDDHGARMMSAIKARMMNEEGEFDEYVKAFGPFYDPEVKHKWAETEIRLVDAPVGKQRDFSLRSRGFNSQVYSIRADVILFDDIQTLNTLSQTKKMLRKIRGTFLTRREGGVKGKVIYLGTHIGANDLPSAMEDEGLVLPENVYKLPLVNDEGVSNFEEVIATADIPLIMRQQGSMFNVVYQQDVSTAGGKTFRHVWRNVRGNYTISDWESPLPPDDEIVARLVTVDPALTGPAALMAMSASMTRTWVHDLVNERDLQRISKINEYIEELVLTYRADEVVVESKSFQKGLLTSEELEEMGTKYGFELVPHTTSNNKYDERYGVAKMELPMSRGHILVPWGDEYSQRKMAPLLEQLQNWVPWVSPAILEQDCVMALWFGEMRIATLRQEWMKRKRRERRQARGAKLKHDRVPGGRTLYRPTPTSSLGGKWQ